ncbi:MAG: hypothetical protein ACWA40_00310 [Planktomarina sp.]
MKFTKALSCTAMLGVVGLLSACGGAATTGQVNSQSARMTTYNFDGQSGFVGVSNGIHDITYTSQNNFDRMSASGGDLIYSTGFDSNVGVIAVAGIDPNVNMGAVSPSGTANFSGTVG